MDVHDKELKADVAPVRFWAYCPGNGTRYELVATSFEPLGHKGQWLVSLVNMGGCMVVWEDGYLSPDYVAEKLRPRIGSFGDGDAVPLAEGIMKLVSADFGK